MPPSVFAPSFPLRVLERVVYASSLFTMAMTIPQVLTIWKDRQVAGVSLLSWASYLFVACLWLVYGLAKRDKTIYLACIGWIILDAAVVVGIMIHR